MSAVTTTRSPQQRMMHAAALLFALAPLVLGFVRVAQTGDDLRVLWLAIASSIGATIPIVANRSRARASGLAALTPVLVGASATTTAIIAGFLRQRSFSVGATMFAIVFGFSWGIGYALDVRSRPGTVPTAAG